MKNVILLFIVLFLASCTKPKEEQMLYEYIDNNMKKLVNVSANDANYKLISINETGTITGKDSMDYYKGLFLQSFYSKDSPNASNLNDTLSFSYVKQRVQSIIDTANKIILYNIELDQEYKNYEQEEERDKYNEYMKNLIYWELSFDQYSKLKDSVLSHKYDVSYSIKNPMMNNTKQTFEKVVYSDRANTKIINESEKGK